jgi:hypothetical protein
MLPSFKLTLVQMSVKSTGTPSSPSYFSYRAQISRYNEPQALLWETWRWIVSARPTYIDTTPSPTLRTAQNKVLIVQLGGLTPLIRQMLSPNVEVQCNAVGCITNLATHEENKAKIARSGALGPLTRLAKSRDMRVQRNATGALLNMTHSGMPQSLTYWTVP